MKRLVALVSAAMVLALASAASTARADGETAPVIHYVVDVSGSMAGEKLAQTKLAVQESVEALGDGYALGLRSYSGTCSGQTSVDPLVPIDIDNSAEIIDAANNLTAGGGTPTTAALQEALNDLLLFPTSGEKKVVLLTDGDTQCGISICEFVKQNWESDALFTLYTVGLQTSGSVDEDLTCAAETTGGKFVSAEDPSQLVDILLEITDGMTDADEDGLPDEWEDEGRLLPNGFRDTTLKDGGASSEHKDLFVKIDYAKGMRPSQNALKMITDAFADSGVDNPDGVPGISIHFVMGSQMSDTDIAAIRNQTTDDDGDTHSSPKWGEVRNRLTTLERGYYHLAVVVKWDDMSSGVAELPGQYFLVNPCKLDPKSDFIKCKPGDNRIAATIMHELGHTLGLHHGGSEPLEPCEDWGGCDLESAYKPNYFSVMSYTFQGTGGIPYDTGASEPTFVVDYSHWGSDDIKVLDENSLDEQAGVEWKNDSMPDGLMSYYTCEGAETKSGNTDFVPNKNLFTVGEPVNWNCNKKWGLFGSRIESDPVSTNIDGLDDKIVLSPFDDWEYLNQNGRMLNQGVIGTTREEPAEQPILVD